MIKSKIFRRPKHIILFSLFALLLYMGHQTGFISILSIFCLLVLLIIPLNRYIDILGFLLLAFTGCFTIMGLLGGFISSLSAAIAYFIPTIFFYCFGKYIVDILGSKDQMIVVLLAVVALYSCELYMSTIESVISTGSVVNTSRLFYIDGDEGRKLTATLVGLGVSLGFIGLPMSILYKEKKIIRGIFIIVFLLSLITTIHLVNRTGLVIGVLTLVITLLYYYRTNTRQLLIALILSFVVYLLLQKFGVINQEVFDAYAARNEADVLTGGGRTERWSYALRQLFLSPFGWAENSGKTEVFVHNMWLDIAKITGIIPFILLCFSTLSSFNTLGKLIRIKRDVIVAMLLSLNVCFFCSCFVEPVYGGLHFFLYVMLWGVQKQYLVRFSRL